MHNHGSCPTVDFPPPLPPVPCEHHWHYHTGTAADKILAIMDLLMDGHMPDVKDVVMVRAAILHSSDIYQPLALDKQLEESSLDVSGAGPRVVDIGGMGMHGRIGLNWWWGWVGMRSWENWDEKWGGEGMGMGNGHMGHGDWLI